MTLLMIQGLKKQFLSQYRHRKTSEMRHWNFTLWNLWKIIKNFYCQFVPNSLRYVFVKYYLNWCYFLRHSVYVSCMFYSNSTFWCCCIYIQDDLHIDEGEIDIDIMVQLLAPLLNSQQFLVEELKTAYRSVACRNGFIFVFAEVSPIVFLETGWASLGCNLG